MTPLIDGDLILYEIGFATQQKIGGEIVPAEVEEVNQKVDKLINDICAAVYATEPPQIFLTGYGNFRFNAAKQRAYKGNRKKIKPFHYKYIKAYLQAQWGAVVVNGMEADDALCIEQTKRLKQRDTIICSRDKDLKQCPGFHYTWECHKQGSWGPAWVENPGTLVLKGPKKITGTGTIFFYSQLLTGDSTDTYDGLPGCGPIRAFEILNGLEDEADMYRAVLDAYLVKFPEDAAERVNEQAQLAYMIREVNEDGSIKHWTPPVQEWGPSEANRGCHGVGYGWDGGAFHLSEGYGGESSEPSYHPC